METFTISLKKRKYVKELNPITCGINHASKRLQLFHKPGFLKVIHKQNVGNKRHALQSTVKYVGPTSSM